MHLISWTLLAQATDGALVGRLETIMWAQVVMAAVMVLCALAILAGAGAILLLVRRAMRKVEEAKDEILPHVTPVLSRAATIADDVREVTSGVRRDAESVHEAVEDVLGRGRAAVDDLEERVRRFGAVLEVVQRQTEEILLDAAATARGVQTTARALRGEREDPPSPSGRRRGRG